MFALRNARAYHVILYPRSWPEENFINNCLLTGIGDSVCSLSLRSPVLLQPTKFPKQELFVCRAEIEPLASLLDERGRPVPVFCQPCDGAAQGFPFRHDGRDRHGAMVVPSIARS